METLILEDLRNLGKSISAKEFKKLITGGPKSIKYTQLVEWITKEIQILLGLEEHVNSISTEADSSSFLLEVSSFLKESGCSYNNLVAGNFEDRLNSDENKLLLLDYLIGELRASRILNASTTNTKRNMQVTLIESNTSKYVKEILMTLKLPKPPQDISTTSLFEKVNKKLQELLISVPPALIGKSLVSNSYSSEQWKYINNSIELLNEEFNVRSKMSLTRLDVTVQSFKWPDRLKNKKQKLDEIYQTKLNIINKLPNFCISDFLSARNDLAIVEKTSSTLVVQNTNSSVNKVMIGQVPDRGGRPNEQQAPPPEMPSWQQRTQSQGGRGSQSNRGVQFNNRGGRGGSSQTRDNQPYRNSNTGGFQGGSNVYQMTDGFQSISVGNESRNFHQNNRRGRVQGGWNNNQSRDYHSGNFHEGQNRTYDNYSQGTHQNMGYDNNRFQGTSNERQWSQEPHYGNSQDQYDGNNRQYNDTNKRGYSKRGRGHNGQTYYNQQRNY
ncbi:protein FAM98A [Melanaphis sacchari]|uniref:Protein FAM98A n=1 Tax=Melanaphis sacchari TaxID=742174 RepID=A0A2H8TPS3_9HEMI|nr:protein FAM98A [Melanaphis sacchari]XP_025205669.1 protein FAM98A [Melanaphis sacchari]